MRIYRVALFKELGLLKQYLHRYGAGPRPRFASRAPDTSAAPGTSTASLDRFEGTEYTEMSVYWQVSVDPRFIVSVPDDERLIVFVALMEDSQAELGFELGFEPEPPSNQKEV